MSCARYHELISRYADNEVTPRQRQDLLHHVEQCHDCAAWLARVRQAEVLLKGVPDTRPSDRVRSAVLQTVRQQSSPARAPRTQQGRPDLSSPRKRRMGLPLGGLGLGLLLRFDPSPRRIALSMAACLVALTALAYQFNLFAPFWGYDKLGFDVAGETDASVNISPIPAISSGYKGVGGPVTVPSLMRLLPAASATDVALDEPLRLRFDQPMDRASVESVLKIEPPASGIFSWDADNEVRFSPSSPGFLRGVTYKVSLSGTARSIAGTPLDGPVSWSFRTRNLPSVVPDLPLDFAQISPTSSLAFAFSSPMDEDNTERHISLYAAGSQEDIPVALTWHEDGNKLSVSPRVALPEGKVSLFIGALARTRSGETLGRPYEFTYDVALPTPRLRFIEGRIAVADLNSPLSVQYEAIAATASLPNADDVPLSNVELKLYTLAADRVSLLGAELDGWPRPLSSGFLDGLPSLDGVQVTLGTHAYDTAEISGLRAGIYLLSITAPSKAGPLSDWQIVVVADGSLTLVESGGPFWAIGPDGRGWQNAEVSVYSPSGVLIDRGLTGDTGLWFPASTEEQASLALAQDAAGHLAAYWCGAGKADCTGKVEQIPAPFILQTDRTSYLPGQSVNFQVLTGPLDGISQGTPVAEQEVSVSLLMPGGSTVSVLKLKPDSTGSTGGLFNLSPDLLPGLYTLRVSSGAATRDFPLKLEALPNDGLNVYIVPSTDLQTAQTSTLTHTVSIIGPGGAPAVGAVITATLRIKGDSWTSRPVKAATDPQGRASVTLPLPAWVASYNEPGIYLHVEAVAQARYASATSYLDMTSTRSALAGVRQLVSPSLGVAVVAPPAEEGNTRLRVVGLGAQKGRSDLLVLAYSTSGERAAWSLDLSAHAKSDVTLPIPTRFAGGRVLIKRAGVEGSRELALLPPQNENISLQVTAAGTVLPGASLPVSLTLNDKDGQPLAGSASIQFRPVSGALDRGVTHGWEPNLSINSEGRASTLLSAPTMPGLWYVIAHAAALDGSHTWSWSVLRVLPGPFVQVPPAQNGVASEAQTISVVVHNPTRQELSTGLRVLGGLDLTVLGDNSQRVDVRAGGWERLTWRLLPLKPGLSTATFSFMPSASIGGSWPLGVQSMDNPRAKTTYVSGSASGERLVGVQVPSGLSDNDVELEIHASTSLLTTLGGIASALPSVTDGDGGGVVAAARLSAGASVASAYRRLGASIPPTLAYSAVERSLLLQQIYSEQHPDGGWSTNGVDDEGTSTIVATSHILLSLRRYNLAWADTGGDAYVPPVDSTLLKRGLAYLLFQADRALPAKDEQALLDERAYAFYVLSMYGMLDAELARPMMANIGEKPGVGLSDNGQAWLAMALLQSGATQDALALVDRLVLEAGGQARASAPLLEAFVAAGHIEQQGRSGPLGISDYHAAAEATTRSLMNNRQGIGWRSAEETASALWALSRYAVEAEEKPQRDAPTILLNDQLVQTDTQTADPGTISIAVAGDALHAGTNWLKLRASEGRTLYFSLILRATR